MTAFNEIVGAILRLKTLMREKSVMALPKVASFLRVFRLSTGWVKVTSHDERAF